MKYIDRDNISEIFIGRKKILLQLQKKLNKKNNENMAKRPYFVYTLLNTPGIGKTKAVNHFGARRKSNPRNPKDAVS